MSGAFDTPNIKVGQMCDIWKNRSWSAVDVCNRFFWIFSNLTSFSRKSDKNRGFLHISALYIKVGQILGLSKNGSWDLVDAHRFFFMGHELEHAQEALEMCQNTLAYLRK